MFYSKFAKDYEAIFPFSQGTFDVLESYLPLGKKAQETAILDVGCATGHYCGAFHRRGIEAHGIDLDESMIDSAQKNYPGPEFRVMNLTDIKHLRKSYDLVFSTGNVMAHVDKLSLGKYLVDLQKILKPGGLWIFQVVNWDYILEKKDFIFPIKETPGKIFHRSYSHITDESLKFHTKLLRKGSGEAVFADDTTLYPLRSEDYRGLHFSTGFELVDHFGGFDKVPFEVDKFSANVFIFRRG